jgi:hypothetical protein
MRGQFDVNEIRLALRPSVVLHANSVTFKRHGGQLRFAVCPTCGQRSRIDAVTANEATGLWHCHPGRCSGDVIAMVAGFAGLNVRAQFPQVLAMAAELAGIAAASNAERTQRRSLMAQRERARMEQQQRELQAKAASGAEIARECWNSLAHTSAAGQAYVIERGLRGIETCSQLRYSQPGWPCVELFAFNGELCNVITRRFDDAVPTPWPQSSNQRWPHILRSTDEPKVRGLRGCTTIGTMIERICNITDNRDVVVPEGVFDALTARLVWPDAIVLGANGVGNLPAIVAATSPLIRDHGGRLLLVVDGDDAGIRGAKRAIASAVAARVPVARIVIVDIADHHDLNDAWRAGWRP